MPEPTNKRADEQAPPLPMMMGRPGGGPGGGPGAHFMRKVEKAKNPRGTVLRLWIYLRRQRAALVVAGLAVLITVGLTLMGPYLLGVAIDEAMVKGDLPALARTCALMLVVYALNSFFTWVQAYVMAGASQRTVRDLRNDLFE
ncbi:MAG: ABC transporter transmembrane domain-containing protein, partial [Anaerolineae bacterium]|nr:ABC transporter transmembrane domain-containing protein [Anaerolineae bacterium]